MLFVAAAAGALGRWKRAPIPGRQTSAFFAACIPLLAVFSGLHPALSRREGPIEWLTEGVLLAVLVRAAWQRDPLFVCGAGLLLAEEWDWGQRWTQGPTPPWIADLGSRSSRLNFHNIPPWDGLWRVLPWLCVAGLAVHGTATHRHPSAAGRLRRWILGPLALAPALGLGIHALSGAAVVDEYVELALVAVVALGWWPASDQPELRA